MAKKSQRLYTGQSAFAPLINQYLADNSAAKKDAETAQRMVEDTILQKRPDLEERRAESHAKVSAYIIDLVVQMEDPSASATKVALIEELIASAMRIIQYD